MNEVFLDLETKKWFDEVGKRDPAKLGVSFVGIYTRKTPRKVPILSGPRGSPVSRPKVGIYGTRNGSRKTRKEGGEFLGFFEKDFVKLWPILEDADLIIGYNIKKFDYPVLAPYYSGDLTRFPTLDLFEVVKEEVGVRLKLNDLAQATLGMVKNGRGEEAVWFYKKGKLDQLAKYCLQDVRLTRDLYDYMKEFGKIAFFDVRGEKKEVEIDLEKWLPKKEKSPSQMRLEIRM